MRTSTRLGRVGAFGVWALLAAGCGGSEAGSQPEAKGGPGAAVTPAPAAPPSPGLTATAPPAPVPPPPPVDPWELDPAKQKVPATAVAGRLAGAAFAPAEVTLLGDTLAFRTFKEGAPTQEISLTFSPKAAASLSGGLTLTIKQDQLPGDMVPAVNLPQSNTSYSNGYGLTLELGKRVGGRVPGKVYLALDDDAKTYLAGSFVADWQRPAGTPPGADDAPFVQGTVTTGDGAAVRVGYVWAKADGSAVTDWVETPLTGKGGFSQSNESKPRITTLFQAADGRPAGRYEHIHLEPGRYLVFAKRADGPAAWKWVTVEAGAQLAADFALEGVATGKAEVSRPKDAAGKVYLSPADGPDAKTPRDAAVAAALALGLAADARDGSAVCDRLAPGRYDVWAEEKLGSIEVKAGETAKLDAAKVK